MSDREDELDRERRASETGADRPASIEAFRGLAAAYALDALDADERAAFERALVDSPELREEVDAWTGSTRHLAEQVEPVAPPSSVRERLMAGLDSAPQVTADAPAPASAEVSSTSDDPLPTPRADEVDTPPPAGAPRSAPVGPAEETARRRWFQRPGAIIAAAAAAVVLIAGVVLGIGWPGPNGWGAQREMARLAAAPDAQSQVHEVAGGGEVTLVSSAEQGRSAVVLEGLPELAADQTYELWYIDEAGADPAGTFDVRGPETWRVLDGTFSPGVVIGITVEPAGGSPQPTTEPIVAIET